MNQTCIHTSPFLFYTYTKYSIQKIRGMFLKKAKQFFFHECKLCIVWN